MANAERRQLFYEFFAYIKVQNSKISLIFQELLPTWICRKEE